MRPFIPNPLIKLTDCDGRLSLKLASCLCTATPTALLLTRAGCVEYEQVVQTKMCKNHSFGCCPPVCLPTTTVINKAKVKPSITYPLHEIDCENNAVFVLDGKLKKLGYGRYTAQILHGDAVIFTFDVDYVASDMVVTDITTVGKSSMGARC